MKLREYCEQKLEALGLAPKMEFELDDGSTIELVHPWLWDDKTKTGVANATSDIDRVKAILGAADHKRLIAAGGSSNQILFVIEMMKTKSDKAESDPKDS